MEMDTSKPLPLTPTSTPTPNPTPTPTPTHHPSIIRRQKSHASLHHLPSLTHTRTTSPSPYSPTFDFERTTFTLGGYTHLNGPSREVEAQEAEAHHQNPNNPNNTATTTTTIIIKEEEEEEEEEEETEDEYEISSIVNSDSDQTLTLHETSNTTLQIPPVNLRSYWTGIYQSGRIREENFNYLRTLRLKSILCLLKSDVSMALIDFTIEEGITLFISKMGKTRRGRIDDEAVLQAVRVCLFGEGHPILVFDREGKHRIGVVMGTLRKVTSNWGIESVGDEYRHVAGGEGRECDVEYIKDVDVEVFGERFKGAFGEDVESEVEEHGEDFRERREVGSEEEEEEGEGGDEEEGEGKGVDEDEEWEGEETWQHDAQRLSMLREEDEPEE